MKAALNLSFLFLTTKSYKVYSGPIGFTGYEEMIQLPALNGNPNTLTMSGTSAGAIFGAQMQVAFSQKIKGVGVESPMPYMAIKSPYEEGDNQRDLLGKFNNFV
jgi:hypothetical protein